MDAGSTAMTRSRSAPSTRKSACSRRTSLAACQCRRVTGARSARGSRGSPPNSGLSLAGDLQIAVIQHILRRHAEAIHALQDGDRDPIVALAIGVDLELCIAHLLDHPCEIVDVADLEELVIEDIDDLQEIALEILAD